MGPHRLWWGGGARQPLAQILPSGVFAGRGGRSSPGTSGDQFQHFNEGWPPDEWLKSTAPFRLAKSGNSAKGDSTDARCQQKLSTGDAVIPGTLLTRFGDSADATRGYPEDSTDETNSLDLIPFN